MLKLKQALLSCATCGTRKQFTLTTEQLGKLAEDKPQQFYCNYCRAQSYWKAAEPMKLTPQEAPDEAGPKKILLVDDDDLTLQLLEKVLEAENVHIEMAPNGKEALEKLASTQFHLIICDIQMPEIRGEELFQHIQENGLLAPHQIIFLTGDKSAAVKKFLESSGCSYVYKPFAMIQFAQQVESALAQ